MEIGDIVGGFESQDGIHLNTIVSKEDGVVGLETIIYTPDSEEFAWALAQLNAIIDS